MSSKRSAAQELNHENWNDEEESEEAGMFKKASESELQQRVRKTERKRSPPDSETNASCESEEMGSASFDPALKDISISRNSDELPEASSSKPTNEKPASPILGRKTDYQENYYANQGYTVNQQGQYIHDPFSQQNYSCFTPTINSTNSYMTSQDSLAAQTTQSVNYNQGQKVAPNSCITHLASAMDSPHRQPPSIPTYSAAVNKLAMNSNELHMTHSQQQIVSSKEKRDEAPIDLASPVKSPSNDLFPLGVPDPPSVEASD